MKVIIETDVWTRTDVPIRGAVNIHIQPENVVERERLDEVYADIIRDIGYAYGYLVSKVGSGSTLDFDRVEIVEVEVLLGLVEGSPGDVEEFVKEKAKKAEKIADEIKDILENRGFTVSVSKRYYPHLIS